MDHVAYRPPLLARIWVATFTTGVEVFIIVRAIATGGGRGADAAGICFGVLFMALVAAFGYRLFRVGVVVDGGEVVVRNLYKNHRVRRDEIRGFGRAKPTMSGFETITIQTDFTSISLDVLAARQPGEPKPNRPSRAYYRRENALAVLSDWAASRDGDSDVRGS